MVNCGKSRARGENTFSLVGKQKLSSKAAVLHFHLVSPFSTLYISESLDKFVSYSIGRKVSPDSRPAGTFRNYRPLPPRIDKLLSKEKQAREPTRSQLEEITL